jgi:hypothetical protein
VSQTCVFPGTFDAPPPSLFPKWNQPPPPASSSQAVPHPASTRQPLSAAYSAPPSATHHRPSPHSRHSRRKPQFIGEKNASVEIKTNPNIINSSGHQRSSQIPDLLPELISTPSITSSNPNRQPAHTQSSLIRRWLAICVIDHQRIYRYFFRLELQPQLLLNGGEEVRKV